MSETLVLESPSFSAAPATRRQRLSDLPSGGTGTVTQIDQVDAAIQRLMAMGLCVGRQVTVIRQGNPLIIRLLGARVGLSRRVAEQIVVDPGMI